jgi:hypothetical protein
MTIINNFVKKRIEQLLKEYGSPDLVIEQLRDIIPAENSVEADGMLVLEEYIRKIWEKEIPASREQYHSGDFTDGDLAEMMYIPEKFPLSFTKSIRKDLGEEISDDMVYTLGRLEESFCEKMLDEEITAQYNLAELELDLSEYTDELKILPPVSDTLTLIKHFNSEKMTKISRKQDGEIKKNFIKKASAILTENKRLFHNPEDHYDYTEMLLELITESGIIDEDEDGRLFSTDITSKILKGKTDYSKIYTMLFKTWWMNYRDFFTEKHERQFFIDPGEVEFKIASLLLTAAAAPAFPQDIYVPAIVNNLLDYLSYRPLNVSDGKMSVLQGIKDTHFYYFKMYNMMGILQIVADKSGQLGLKLSEFGAEMLKAFFDTYPPLLKADVQLTTAFDMVKSFTLLFSIFFAKGDAGIRDQTTAGLDQMMSEIELAINSFFLYVADSKNDGENINQIKISSDHILARVFETINIFKSNVRYNNIVENLFITDK